MRRRTARSLLYQCLLICVLATPVQVSAVTFQQIPFRYGAYEVPKLTRLRLLSDPDIENALFHSLAGGTTLSVWNPSGNEIQIATFLDPTCHRFLYAVSVDGDGIHDIGGYGGGTDRFRNPTSMDLSPAGHLYIADTGNNRVVMYGFVMASGGGYLTYQFMYVLAIPGASDFESPNQVVLTCPPKMPPL